MLVVIKRQEPRSSIFSGGAELELPRYAVKVAGDLPLGIPDMSEPNGITACENTMVIGSDERELLPGVTLRALNVAAVKAAWEKRKKRQECKSAL
mmetsp:Transcript_63594/g.132394  ORF Transcript_63594/g.132394 Transcript_63594/m.132394 type:complete len:95 (-) Transcript_63594:100-384(-)